MRSVQLSMLQILSVLTALIVSTGHFLFVRIVFIQTGRDGWMVILPSIAVGSLVFYAVMRIAKQYPNHTLIEATMAIFGKWVGRLVALPYLLFFMSVPALLIRSLGDFLPTTMPYTPYGVITSVLVVLASISARLGVEVIGRCALLMLPLLLLLGILAATLTLKDKHYEYLLPIAEMSWRGVLRGTATLSGLFSEVIIAGMLVNFVRPNQLKAKTVLVFFAVIGVTFIGPLTGPVAIFDIESASKFNYPTYEEIRYIEVANFLERLDVVGIILWASGVFLKLSIFLYALAKATAQWFGLQEYRPLVLPFAIMLLFQAASVASSRAEIWVYLSKVYPLFVLTIGLLLPWLTLLVGRFRKKTSATASPT